MNRFRLPIAILTALALLLGDVVVALHVGQHTVATLPSVTAAQTSSGHCCCKHTCDAAAGASEGSPRADHAESPACPSEDHDSEDHDSDSCNLCRAALMMRNHQFVSQPTCGACEQASVEAVSSYAAPATQTVFFAATPERGPPAC